MYFPNAFVGALLGLVLGPVSALKVSQDGKCGDWVGRTCLGSYSGDCCSQYGYCGSSSDYCGWGCQKGFGKCGFNDQPPSSPKVSKDGRCGGNSGYTCKGYPWGSCCSKWGWCGSSDEYCGKDCNGGYGDCNGQQPSNKPTSSKVIVSSTRSMVTSTSNPKSSSKATSKSASSKSSSKATSKSASSKSSSKATSKSASSSKSATKVSSKSSSKLSSKTSSKPASTSLINSSSKQSSSQTIEATALSSSSATDSADSSSTSVFLSASTSESAIGSSELSVTSATASSSSSNLASSSDTSSLSSSAESSFSASSTEIEASSSSATVSSSTSSVTIESSSSSIEASSSASSTEITSSSVVSSTSSSASESASPTPDICLSCSNVSPLKNAGFELLGCDGPYPNPQTCFWDLNYGLSGVFLTTDNPRSGARAARLDLANGPSGSGAMIQTKIPVCEGVSYQLTGWAARNAVALTRCQVLLETIYYVGDSFFTFGPSIVITQSSTALAYSSATGIITIPSGLGIDNISVLATARCQQNTEGQSVYFDDLSLELVCPSPL